jgi:cell division protein FtsI/penicillin-binding protein 2
MDNIQSADGNIVEQYTPEVENEFKIQERNLAAIKQGMLLVTTGEDGTLTNAFKDFPIKVGAKSGTAQEADDRSEHTTLTAFVPYENPQIAISVLIPYGNDSATAPASVVTQGIISQYFGLDNKSETLSYNTLNES